VFYDERLAVVSLSYPVARSDQLAVFAPHDLWQRRSSVYAVQLNPLAAQSDFVFPSDVLPLGGMFVLTGGSARRDDVQQNFIAQLVFVSEHGRGSARVIKVIRGIVPRDVTEPEISLRVQGHPRVVDRFDTTGDILNQPIYVWLGPAIGRLASEFKGRTLVRVQGNWIFVFERVQLGFSNEHRVRRGDAPFVLGETLILS